MIEQLPSLQQIYDFSSSDLRTLADSLQKQLLARPDNQQLQDYIENINIELEQRKTLQFFQEMCAIDNPYLRKVTDFNNQFLQLAEEALAQQQAEKLPQLPVVDHKTKFVTENQQRNNDAMSVTSATPSHLALTDMDSIDVPKSTDKIYSTSSKKTWKEGDKKMGVGSAKGKSKNAMKDFIMNALNKNKAEGCYVIKKGGPPKPQPAFTVNERGHLVSPSTLQPISSHNIKPQSNSSKPPSAPSSMKQLSQAPNKLNEKAMLERRQEVMEKMRGKKAEKKKEKPLNNKDLVAMIRQEEQAKQDKKKRSSQNEQIQSKNIEQKQISEHPQEKQVQQCKKQDLPISDKKMQQKQKIQEVIQTDNKITKNESEKQKIKQQIVNKQITQKSETRNENNQSQPQNIQVTLNQQVLRNDIKKQYQSEPPFSDSTRQDCQEKGDLSLSKQAQTSEQDKYVEDTAIETGQTQIIKQQASVEKQMTGENKTAVSMLKKQEPFGKIIDLSEQIQKQVKEERIEQPHKKCYNEQYWIHIRQEAQFQIKRFKQQKQLEQNHKSKLKKDIRQSTTSVQPQEKKQQQSQAEQNEEKKDVTIEKQAKALEQEVIDEYYQKKKKELKRMVDDHKKRVVTKRPTPATIAPLRPLYAKPTFNYLEIYPTFNHIFSVMYTKAEHQAIQDIPAIMRQITNIFSTHQNHFKDKGTVFQPAIFLPFDSSSKFQMRDPRQLLVHTESTYVNLKKMVERLEIFNSNLQGEFRQGQNRYYRVVKSKEEVYDIITSGFLRRKFWKQLPHGCSLRASWNLFWSWSKPDIDISRLLVWQRINHFPFNKNLSRKDLLYRNLDSFRKLIKIPFNFLPLTYNLPKEYTQFSIKFHQEELLHRDCNYWIMKPIGKSRGRGIKVISSLAELNYTDNIVVQKYITNPLLLDGYKFDMRIYVLVTSFHPLQAFVYREGFARLSTQKFSLDPIMIKNAFVHLTNFSVNKNNEDAKQSANFSGGSKISLKTLKDKLTKMDYSFSRIWTQVHQIIIKSLLGCSVSVPPFPAAFQLFGYDIMIDDNSNCHLIEINASPSLERAYFLDQIVKQSLIDDILDIVDPPDFDKQQLLDVMTDRLSGKGKISPEEDLIALARVLKYKPVRKFGQMPENMGLFQRVAPCQLSGELQRLIKSRSGANNPRNID